VLKLVGVVVVCAAGLFGVWYFVANTSHANTCAKQGGTYTWGAPGTCVSSLFPAAPAATDATQTTTLTSSTTAATTTAPTTASPATTVSVPSNPSTTTGASQAGSPGAGGCDCSVADLPRHCDTNISATSDLSCQFAENTFYEYYNATHGNADEQIAVQAWSSPSQRYDPEACSSGDGVVDCVHGSGSDVRFNQSAIAAYTPSEAAAYAAASDLGPSG
jgi:hypothetical protein